MRLIPCVLASVAILFTACIDDPVVNPDDSSLDNTATPSVVLLNEGTWGANNASLTRFDNRNGKLIIDWFAASNGRGMGDLAQDLVLYGSKLYATVSESGSLEVIDTASGHSSRVDLGTRYPRYIAASGGKLYVSCYNPHSVIRIDTVTLAIEATCMLGDYHPEGIAVVGSRLVVASSNVSDAQGNFSYDSVVYVIDMDAFADPEPLTVGYNPQRVKALDGNRVVVNYVGNYGSAPAGAAVVDVSNRSVTQLGVALTNMTVQGDCLYGYASTYSPDYSSLSTEYVRFDVSTLASTPILADCGVDRPYAIGVDPCNGNLLVASDGNYVSAGTVYCFTSDGQLRWSHQVGYFPSNFVFLPAR